VNVDVIVELVSFPEINPEVLRFSPEGSEPIRGDATAIDARRCDHECDNCRRTLMQWPHRGDDQR